MCPNVSEPTSPNLSASGASPIPTESMTIRCTRLNMIIPSFFLFLLPLKQKGRDEKHFP